MCGENLRQRLQPRGHLGSSPRVRGKHVDCAKLRLDRRLIPACAGKTFLGRSDRTLRPAHPRVCGENVSRANAIGPFSGSSPRVRGKRNSALSPAAAFRLIPACAGKTSPHPESKYFSWAHPRVCGENEADLLPPTLPGGSSPRVRGKHASVINDLHQGGLIPACAGKTLLGKLEGDEAGAHPRVCGENCPSVVQATSVAGSSPRVRGKRSSRSLRPRLLRLIPACAGKTCSPSLPLKKAPAHPRVCGENGVGHFGDDSDRGSSPRVRGKRPGRG